MHIFRVTITFASFGFLVAGDGIEVAAFFAQSAKKWRFSIFGYVAHALLATGGAVN
jgi:hypothetical protein